MSKINIKIVVSGINSSNFEAFYSFKALKHMVSDSTEVAPVANASIHEIESNSEYMLKDWPKASMTMALVKPTDHCKYHEATESLNLPILRIAT